MPIVPTSLPASPQIAQLPGVRTPSASPAAFGAGLASGISSLGDSIGQASNTIETARQRLQTRRDAEAAETTLTAWYANARALQDGTVDPATGQVTPGSMSLKSWDAVGSAKKWAEEDRKWLDAPDSPYATLSPAQRKIFERRRATDYQNLFNRSVTHEANQTEVGRADNRKATFTIRDLALQNAVGTPEHESALAPAALSYAIWKLNGKVTRDPNDDTLVFATDSKPDFDAAVQEYTENARLTAASVLASRAADASLDPAGQAVYTSNLDAARAQTELLSEEGKVKANDILSRTSANRDRRAKATAYDAEHAALKAQKDFRDQIDQIENEASRNGYSDIPDRILQIDSLTAKSGPVADHAYATQKRERLLSIAARSAEGDRKDLNEQKARIIELVLNGGWGKDAAGNSYPMSTLERKTRAETAFLQGIINEDRFKSIIANADKDQDKRLGQFHDDATRFLLPELADSLQDAELFTLDKTTERIGIKPNKTYPKRSTPITDSGKDRIYKITYTTRKGTTETKQKSEHIYLGQITEALNIFRERMEIDPSYTPAAALADLKEFIRPAKEEYTKLTIAEFLSQQAWRNNTIRRNSINNRNNILYPPNSTPPGKNP